MMHLSLKAKFTLMSVATIAVIAFAGWRSYAALTTIESEKNTIARGGDIMMRHLQGDMLHDAMRGDVYRAAFALAHGSMEDIDTAAKDFNAHGDAFARHIDDNLRAARSDAPLVSDLKDVEKALGDYRTQGQAIMAALRQDVINQTDKAKGGIADFDAAFAGLEEQQEDLRVTIDRHIQEVSVTADRTADRERLIALVASIVAVMLSLLLPVVNRRWLFEPQKELTDAMEKLAHGELDTPVPFTDRSDEIGHMAKALSVFKTNALDKQRLEKEQDAAKHRAERDRRQAMLGMADDFEGSVQGVVDTVASAATQMDASARSLQERTRLSIDKLGALVMGINGASQNVQTVAGAATQLSASIREISNQVARASTLTGEAVTVAHQATDTAASLRDAADHIGSVVTLINEITGKINLLSLNATIEAARAGEMGKGFAVVASEVKMLAGQTVQATEQIQQQVELIQRAAANTVSVIGDVARKIDDVSAISTSIAAAVEQQGMATQEIARNVSEAAEITKEVFDNADVVKDASLNAGTAVDQMISAVSELSQQSETLRVKVSLFLQGVKAA